MSKKDWVSVFHSSYKENTNTEQISWESSSSEDEHFTFKKKRRKKLSELNCKISPVITFQKSNLHLTDQSEDKAVSSTSFTESPVLGLRRLELYKLSPELSQRSMSNFVREPSPVIEKRRVRLKKKHCKSKKNVLNGCLSPDLFDYEPSQNIISASPIFSVCSSQATINIEPFPSQFSSQVKATDVQKKDNSLYYEPPKRKKKYKKGGLAHQLNRTLKLKTSRVKIWHHEKLNNIEGDFETHDDIIKFKLLKVWNEYGNTMLLCEVINENVNLSVTTKKDSDNLSDTVSKNNFLLNIGTNSILNMEWKTDTIYQLYPPYNKNNMTYCGQDILYYSNTSKFMM